LGKNRSQSSQHLRAKPAAIVIDEGQNRGFLYKVRQHHLSALLIGKDEPGWNGLAKFLGYPDRLGDMGGLPPDNLRGDKVDKDEG
jgi:hypothetical protein